MGFGVSRVMPVLVAVMIILVLQASGAGRGDSVMKTAVFAAERPPIDLNVPEKLETATFALG